MAELSKNAAMQNALLQMHRAQAPDMTVAQMMEAAGAEAQAVDDAAENEGLDG